MPFLEHICMYDQFLDTSACIFKLCNTTKFLVLSYIDRNGIPVSPTHLDSSRAHSTAATRPTVKTCLHFFTRINYTSPETWRKKSFARSKPHRHARAGVEKGFVRTAKRSPDVSATPVAYPPRCTCVRAHSICDF